MRARSRRLLPLGKASRCLVCHTSPPQSKIFTHWSPNFAMPSRIVRSSARLHGCLWPRLLKLPLPAVLSRLGAFVLLHGWLPLSGRFVAHVGAAAREAPSVLQVAARSAGLPSAASIAAACREMLSARVVSAGLSALDAALGKLEDAACWKGERPPLHPAA